MKTILILLCITGNVMGADYRPIMTPISYSDNSADSKASKKAQVEETEVRASDIQSFSAKMDLKVGDYKLDGECIADKDGRMRLKISYFITLMDVGISKNTARVFFPRKSIMFEGSSKEALDACQGLLILADMMGTRVLFPQAWDDNASGRRIVFEEDRTIVYVYKSSDDKVSILKKCIFSPTLVDGQKKMVISKVCRYGNNGELQGVLTYSNYSKNKQGVFYPSNIRIQVGNDQAADFIVSDVEVGKGFDDKRFIPIPPEDASDVQTLAIAELGNVGIKKMLEERKEAPQHGE